MEVCFLAAQEHGESEPCLWEQEAMAFLLICAGAQLLKHFVCLSFTVLLPGSLSMPCVLKSTCLRRTVHPDQWYR